MLFTPQSGVEVMRKRNYSYIKRPFRRLFRIV